MNRLEIYIIKFLGIKDSSQLFKLTKSQLEKLLHDDKFYEFVNKEELRKLRKQKLNRIKC